jgi:hypothetical protein
MVYALDTQAKSGTDPKIASDSRVDAVRAGRGGRKYWEKRTCASCETSFLANEEFKSIAHNRRGDVLVYHDNCRGCRNKIRSAWDANPLFSEELEQFWRQYMPGLRAGAHARHMLVAIDFEDLVNLYLSQHGLCVVSGLELDWKVQGKVGRANRAHLRPSVDRIDSHGNYTIGNIQIVAQAVNMMKGALPQSSFVELCGAIARHNLSL